MQENTLDVFPLYFPGDIVDMTIGKKKLLVTKVGISSGNSLSYMCFDGDDYYWLEDIQLKRSSKEQIGFKINMK